VKVIVIPRISSASKVFSWLINPCYYWTSNI